MKHCLIEVNPAARMRKAGIRKPRERVLPEADIRKFWNALAAMEDLTGEHMAKGEPGRSETPQWKLGAEPISNSNSPPSVIC